MFIINKPKENVFKADIIDKIKTIFDNIPIYDSKKAHQQLLEFVATQCLNTHRAWLKGYNCYQTNKHN